jgi:hypothetical protein
VQGKREVMFFMWLVCGELSVVYVDVSGAGRWVRALAAAKVRDLKVLTRLSLVAAAISPRIPRRSDRPETNDRPVGHRSEEIVMGCECIVFPRGVEHVRRVTQVRPPCRV